MRRREGPAIVPIETTPVTLVPEACPTPQVRRPSIAFDVARGGIVSQHERPCQEPDAIESHQEARSMLLLGHISVQQLDRRFLYFGKPRVDLQFSRWFRPLDPV
jgi:hypothetical protein